VKSAGIAGTCRHHLRRERRTWAALRVVLVLADADATMRTAALFALKVETATLLVQAGAGVVG
jgi:hypothetical protein